MKVILLGATGMVGQGVLRECLRDGQIESVLVIGRKASGQHHEKLHELLHADLLDLSAVEGELSGYDASVSVSPRQAWRRPTTDG